MLRRGLAGAGSIPARCAMGRPPLPIATVSARPVDVTRSDRSRRRASRRDLAGPVSRHTDAPHRPRSVGGVRAVRVCRVSPDCGESTATHPVSSLRPTSLHPGPRMDGTRRGALPSDRQWRRRCGLAQHRLVSGDSGREPRRRCAADPSRSRHPVSDRRIRRQVSDDGDRRREGRAGQREASPIAEGPTSIRMLARILGLAAAVGDSVARQTRGWRGL